MNAMSQSSGDQDPILQPEEHVLSTLEADGSRRWLKPRLNPGKFWWRRRVVAYVLIAIFTLIPFIKIGGKPLVLLDIVSRQFTILGFTFLPTDTLLLAIFVVGILLSVFLFTAMFGRVWCGWACPQTVYMEYLFRPIERLFDGTTGRGGHKKNVPAWRTFAKYLVYFFLCVYLANTFLAYFIGVDELATWVTRSPLEHPVSFAVMAFVTIAMMVDFCYFREQLCLIACPYGRFQSVLLDQNSLIVAYDENRGEPRGKKKKKPEVQSVELPLVGDCIDCAKCVTTCPTGIDIRDGLQMECINCTQCIDACNEVMTKIGRDPNLIRYSSQARDSGKQTSLLRARTIIYPVLIIGIVSAFLTVFLSSKTFDAVVLREPGSPFTLIGEDQVQNNLKLKLTNRTSDSMRFRVEILEPAGALIKNKDEEFVLAPQESNTFRVTILAPRKDFQTGRMNAKLSVENNRDIQRRLDLKLIGPYKQD